MENPDVKAFRDATNRLFTLSEALLSSVIAPPNPAGSVGALAPAPCSAVPSVALPLKLRQRGSDAWVEDAHGREAVSRTCGFASGHAHEEWLRWIVRTANATLKPNTQGDTRPAAK